MKSAQSSLYFIRYENNDLIHRMRIHLWSLTINEEAITKYDNEAHKAHEHIKSGLSDAIQDEIEKYNS